MAGEFYLQNIKTPYTTIAEQGSTPANPDAGHQRLFVSSTDHSLKMVDSTGAITPVGSVSGATLIYLFQDYR